MTLHTYTRIGVRVALVLLVLSFLLYALAVRSNTGITFATGNGQGGFTMTIDNHAIYNGVFQPALSWSLKDLVPSADKFFNFDDIKPGDDGNSTLSIHIQQNPAYVCLDFKNLQNEENGINEPESNDDLGATSTGELGDLLEFFAWRDDGDNLFEVAEVPLFGASTTQTANDLLNEKTYILADALHGPAYIAGSTHYIGILWCAGDLEVDLATAEISCDGSLVGNETQTDSMSVDVTLRAVQADQQTGFSCTGESVEGCSPGYWRQSQHFGNYAAPYTPDTLFSDVFEDAFPGKTLVEVVSQESGGLNALGRQTVAAFLNAASPSVGYPYTAAEVIAKFNAVYPGGEYNSLKDDFELFNTIYCPLARNEGSSSTETSTGKDPQKEKKDDAEYATTWHIEKKSFVASVIESLSKKVKGGKS